MTNTASDPITYNLLLSIIGFLIVFIISVLGWIFKREIAGLWINVNDHKVDIRKNTENISNLNKSTGELSVKIDAIDAEIDKLSSTVSEGFAKLEYDSAQTKITREARDNKMLEKIDDMRNMLVEHILKTNLKDS